MKIFDRMDRRWNIEITQVVHGGKHSWQVLLYDSDNGLSEQYRPSNPVQLHNVLAALVDDIRAIEANSSHGRKAESEASNE